MFSAALEKSSSNRREVGLKFELEQDYNSKSFMAPLLICCHCDKKSQKGGPGSRTEDKLLHSVISPLTSPAMVIVQLSVT